MEKFGLDSQATTQEEKRLVVQRGLESLVHACQCHDANCNLPSCLKMKRIIHHTKICKWKRSNVCPICKQFAQLCGHHVKHCQEADCAISFCLKVKEQLRQRLQQTQVLGRHLLLMNMRTNMPSNALPVNSSGAGPDGVLAGEPVGQADVMSGQPGIDNMVSLQALQELAGCEPHTQTLPAEVLQEFKQMIESIRGYASRQPECESTTDTEVQEKLTPIGIIGGQPQVMPPPEMQQPTVGPTDTDLIPAIDQSRSVPNATLENPGLLKTAPQEIEQQQTQPSQQEPLVAMLTSTHISDPIPPIVLPPSTTGTAMARSIPQGGSLQQIMEVLQYSNISDQEQHLMDILRSNPRLLAALIKHGQIYQPKQQ